ncbi:MAG: MerR family transcriptional regulator [Anaerolineae bacterium]|nr:MerR family transcriptional regulator [Anaerolineae bacterium]
MPSRYLRTSDIAFALVVHPNTVRVYEKWGLLPPVVRVGKNYRQFTEAHLDQMRLVRSAMHFTWIGGELRRTLYGMITLTANGDLSNALEQAHGVLKMIRAERVQAEAAAALLERWARGLAPSDACEPLHIKDAAQLLAVSSDKLRNWERNGLIKVPRDPHSRYRVYGPEEIGRLRIIRTLRQARYSTMAVLRMLVQLDEGRREDLRRALDTPDPDEDIVYVTDRWLSTLAHLEPRAEDIVAQVEAMLERQVLQKSRRGRALPEPPGGRAIVVARFAEALSMALDRVARSLPLEMFRLVGTAAALFQDVFLPVRDVNLLAQSRAQVDAFAVALEGFPCLAPPAWDEETGAYATCFLIRGFEIAVAAVEDAATGDTTDGLETRGRGPWLHCVPVACGAHTVHAVALELRLATEVARGRDTRVAPILRALRLRGCDLPLLRRALEARGVSQEMQQQISMKVKS